MAEIQESASVSQYVLSMLGKGIRREQIETDLVQKGHEERFVKELLQEAIKLHYTKLRAQGLKLILTGAVICFSSFLLTITSTYTHLNFPIVLYGLTSLGIVVVFAGFVKIF